MRLTDFTKTSMPVIAIIKIANPVAVKLIETLLSQGSRVILIDKFAGASRDIVKRFSKDKNVLFMDIGSTFKNIDKFSRLDYIYHFLHSTVVGSRYPEALENKYELIDLTHQDVREESDYVDAYIKLAIEFDAKYSLITCGFLPQLLVTRPETNLQLQKYSESLFEQYMAQSHFNGRIIRLAEVTGELFDLSVPTYFTKLTREIILSETVTIHGDGLQNNYLIDIQDAVYGLLKISFSNKTKGKTLMLSNSRPISTLNLVYKALELVTEEKNVKFLDSVPEFSQILETTQMSVAPIATDVNWETMVALDKSLQKSLEYTSSVFGKKFKVASVEEMSIGKVSTGNVPHAPEKGEKYNKIDDVKQNLAWSFLFALYSTFIRTPYRFLYNLPVNIQKFASAIKLSTIIKSIPVIILVTILAFMVYPYANLAVSGYRLYKAKDKIVSDIANLDTQSIEKDIDLTLSISDSMLWSLKQIHYIRPINPERYDLAMQSVTVLNYTALSAKQGWDGIEPLLLYIKDFKFADINNPAGQTGREYTEYIQKMRKNSFAVDQGAQTALVAYSMFKNIDKNAVPHKYKDKLEKIDKYFKLYVDAYQVVDDYYPHLPFLLGFKDRTNYVIIVQNQDELRATGGWLSNYAVLGLENGKIREFTVDDVYNFDGHFAGEITPSDMKKALSVSKYGLALANWYPQFSKTSTNIKNLFKDSGTLMDTHVVVAINFSVLEDMLKIVGPVDTQSYGTITADNLFDKIVELHSNFKPGSTDKVSLTSQLIPQLIAKIDTLPIDKKQDLIDLMRYELSSRSIQVYSFNKGLMDTLTEYNTFYTFKGQDQAISIIDWNWGGNKADRFVDKKAIITYDIPAKRVKVKLIYKNSSTQNYYPYGIYKDYLRVYVPNNWKLISYQGVNFIGNYPVADDNMQHVLSFLQVNLNSTKEAEFTFITDDIKAINVLKQSGWRGEVTIRVIANKDTDDLFFNQGFVKNEQYWEKTINWKGQFNNQNNVLTTSPSFGTLSEFRVEVR